MSSRPALDHHACDVPDLTIDPSCLSLPDVCYKPASLITPDRLAVRIEAFNNLQTTTHDPISFRVQPKEEPEPNDPGWKVRQQPASKPILTERGKQLVGLVPY